MLALTPVPLKTAGERALFGELTRWDTGGSVRAAVMASLPLADGSTQRRMSDAVLFVPEGLAVVRIAEVVRQSGVVTASPEGAWSIAPESGPSQALQLSGGGSSPLDGLMRAGMDTAMKLRRAGLEPGRIARLTVLVGDVTGLLPPDGDLGEGDQVATLDPRSLLLGIARASRYAGVDNPRLWTTADVRAALEALGLEGRGPSVEELNGEGFPYSPYVLRRAELLTPAAMAAASESAASQASAAQASAAQASAAQAASPPAPSVPAPSSAAGTVPPVREQPAPEAIAQAVAASAAAAQSASAPPAPPVAPPPAAPTPAAPTPAVPLPVQRDTVAIDDPKQEDAGIGGLFAGAEPAGGEPARLEAERRAADRRQSDRAARESAAGTAVFPASAPPPRTSVFAAPAPEPAPAQQRFAYWSESGASTADPDGSDDGDEPSHHLRTALLILTGLVVVALLGIAGWSLLGDRDGNAGGGTAGGASASESPAPGPQAGAVQEVAGVGYTVEAVDVAETCVGHAYGAVADSFVTTDCTALSRALYSSDVGGEAVVVSVARVQMPDAASARALRALADQNGSGNVSDLLREGVRYTGSPAELSGAEYASALSGSTVTIVEAARATEDGQLSDSELDRIAGDALALEVPPFPAA